MSYLQELNSGLFRWSEFSDEKQLNFNGYYLVHREEAVIIDPPDLSDEGMSELKERVAEHAGSPLKAVLLTNVHHDRASLKFKETFHIPIYIHENDKDLLDFTPDHTFKGDEILYCGLKVIHLKEQKSPGESAFLLEDQKKLFVGDALIGKTPGKLNLLPPEKYKDIDKAKEALKVLKSGDFDDLLLGDGEPIQGDAKKLLEAFFND
jgi:glyoxylase-like metal-dependent hydrolase (beta-lactamase superfamily II)